MKTLGKGQRFTCPKCQSDDISSQGFEPEGLYQDVTCNKCDCIWLEFFEAVSWEITQ
jgi:hypothetical protein